MGFFMLYIRRGPGDEVELLFVLELPSISSVFSTAYDTAMNGSNLKTVAFPKKLVISQYFATEDCVEMEWLSV